MLCIRAGQWFWPGGGRRRAAAFPIGVADHSLPPHGHKLGYAAESLLAFAAFGTVGPGAITSAAEFHWGRHGAAHQPQAAHNESGVVLRGSRVETTILADEGDSIVVSGWNGVECMWNSLDHLRRLLLIGGVSARLGDERVIEPPLVFSIARSAEGGISNDMRRKAMDVSVHFFADDGGSRFAPSRYWTQ